MKIGSVSLDNTRNRAVATGWLLSGAGAIGLAVLGGLKVSGVVNSVPVLGRVHPAVWFSGTGISGSATLALPLAFRRSSTRPKIEVEEAPPLDPAQVTLQKEKEEIRAIKAEWHRDDHGRERRRLETEGVLGDDLRRRIRENFSREKQKEAAVLLGHAWQIREKYKDTHYVFTHAQGEEMNVITTLIGELVKVLKPEQKRLLFKNLRMPDRYNPGSLGLDVEFFFRRYQAHNDSFHDRSASEAVLSVDGLFWSQTAGGESAWYWLDANSSAMWANDPKAVKRLLNDILEKFVSNSNVRNDLVEQVFNCARDYSLQRSQRVGCLYLICIPKKEVDFSSDASRYVYLSHPFGRPCMHYRNREEEVLEALQAGTVCGDDGTAFTECPSEYGDGPVKKVHPQFRILTEGLAQSEGARVLLVHTQPKEERDQLKRDLRELIENAVESDRKAHDIV